VSTTETAAAQVPQTGAAARAERHATVRRLAQEEGLSARAIAKRMGISRYQVGRILADQTGQAADESGRVADQGPAGGRVAGPVADVVAGDPAALVGQSGQVADGGGLFVPFREGLGTDLTDLMRTGCTAVDAVDYAVAVLADAYRNALQLGLLADGDALDVAAVTFRPPARAATAPDDRAVRPARPRPGRAALPPGR
jgi:hypothetical protein